MERYMLFVLFVLLFVACDKDAEKGTDADTLTDADTASGDELLTDADESVAPIISEVKVTPNEKSPLTCTVSWKTDIAASSFIEFGEGSYEFVIGAETPTKDHKVIVVGMHAEKLYSLRAVSEANDLRVESTEKTFLTPALPEQVVVATVKLHEKGKTFDGWTAVNLSAGDIKSGPISQQSDTTFPETGVIYDMDGMPVWYYVHNMPVNGDAEYFEENGTILFSSMSVMFSETTPVALLVNLAGETVWEGPAQPVNVIADTLYQHGVYHMPDGNWLTIRQTWHKDTNILGDILIEMTPEFNELWSWNFFDYLTPDTTGWDPETTPVFDWTHINSIDYDPADDTVYANSRNLDSVFKIGRKDGDILWTLGSSGDFTFTGQNDSPWFLRSHGMEKLDNGNIIMFDNGDAGLRPWSRAVEYELDETAKTAQIVWEYRGEESFFVSFWGDADRLPNGNTLISAANWDTNRNSHLFEADAEGHTVWDIEFPHHGEYAIGFYDACRFVPPTKKIVPKR